MATKLRKLATSAITKAILWAVFLAFSFMTVMGFVSVFRAAYQGNLPMESLNMLEYTDSQDFMLYKRDIVAALYWKYDVNKLYGAGKAPSVYYRAEYEDGSVSTNVPGQGQEFFTSHQVYGIYQTRPDGHWQELALSDERLTVSPFDIAYGQAHLFKDNQHGFSSYREFNPLQDDVFMLDMPKEVPPAVREWLSRQYGGSYANMRYDNAEQTAEATVVEKFSDTELHEQYQEWLLKNPIPQATVCYAFDDAELNAYESFWYQCRSYYMAQFANLLGLALAALAAAAWLLAVCGRKAADTELHLWFTERLWSEVTLGAGLCVGVGFFALLFSGVDSLVFYQFYKDAAMLNLFCAGITALAAVLLLIAMSLTRLMKAHKLIRNSLTFKVCYWFWRPCKKLYDMLRSCFDERSFRGYPLTKALQRRQMVFFGVLGVFLLFLLTMFLAFDNGFLLTCTLVLTLALGAIAYWHVTGNIKTYREINAGFNESLEEQMKSERTKTALITNVSHDLKTPLTSIITYLDLLGKEELPDAARDYVAVLTQKSDRLKSIVADLFDLSKSVSGNIPLDMEDLDLKRLIEQTLADMKDTIDVSGLVMKVKLPEGEVTIRADGKKLYRVFQNIIDNALKYSLTGTRVFITLETENGIAVATVKNTAAYEMDFTAEEVLQRFSRGDSSRTGDGSGLGLSIAESFTNACGGGFRVELDGDLFKVTIRFDLR